MSPTLLAPSVRSSSVTAVHQGESLPGWDLEFMQMSHGQVQGQQTVATLPGLQLVRERYDGVVLSQCGVAHKNSVLVGLPVHMSDEALCNGMPWKSGACIIPGDREYHAKLPPHDLLSVVLDRSTLAAYIRETEGVDIQSLLDKRMWLAQDPALVGEASRRVHDLLRALQEAQVDVDDPVIARSALDAVLEVIGPLMASVADAPRVGFREISHTQIVRTARDHVMAHKDEPLRILDICRATGVSRRALQDSFNDVLGVSPLAYLRLLRLNGVRRALSAPTPELQIKDVVAQWGVWHLGRLGGEYKALFGELPSETLKRHKAMRLN